MKKFLFVSLLLTFAGSNFASQPADNDKASQKPEDKKAAAEVITEEAKIIGNSFNGIQVKGEYINSLLVYSPSLEGFIRTQPIFSDDESHTLMCHDGILKTITITRSGEKVISFILDNSHMEFLKKTKKRGITATLRPNDKGKIVIDDSVKKIIYTGLTHKRYQYSDLFD